MNASNAPRRLAIFFASLLGVLIGLGAGSFTAWGFEVVKMETRSDRDRPQICLHFDEALPARGALEISDYIRITPGRDMALSASGKTVCADGARHGARYRIELRPGLISAAGAVLTKGDTVELTVQDRAPALRLPGTAYVLPVVGARGVGITTVNVETVNLELYRVDDRGLVNQINQNRLRGDPGWYGREQIENRQGERVWTGSMEVSGPRNREVTTLFPIDDALKRRAPGIYMLSARTANATASQWIVASDIGLTTFNGRKGMSVAARSLASARPLGDLRIELLARNNSILAEAVTDAAGMAHFDAGFLRGGAGRQAVAITAARVDADEEPSTGPMTPNARKPAQSVGDFNFIDITGPAFDLSDRGMEGREYPGPVDGYLYLDRGIYRPGERARAVALIRDDKGEAIPDLPITFRLYRPDGTEIRRVVKPSGKGGEIDLPLDFARTDATGRWSLAAHVEIFEPAIASASFQIADFVPPKVALELAAAQPYLVAETPAEVVAQADFLYGAPASGLVGEFAISWERRAIAFEKFRRYRFGLAGEDWTPIHQRGKLTATDGKGRARLQFTPPPLVGSTIALEARLRLTVFEDGGRPVNNQLSLPFHRAAPMIGIRPYFDDGRVDLNVPARFDIIAIDPTSERPVALEGARWELFEEDHDYFWYQEGGVWKWRTTVSDRSVDSGPLTLEVSGPSGLTLRRDWGHYRLEVFDPATQEASSFRYSVGWSSSPSGGGELAPDKLEVKLDAESYRAGDVAIVRINPPFNGEVMLSVLTDKVEHTIQFQARRGGTQIRLPVSDWGVGAYVAATAFHPAPASGGRGPARAIGLAWLNLDQAARRLEVSIHAPKVITPRQTIDVVVSAQGYDGSKMVPSQAMVTLAAVDEAVLRLTDFATPDPSAHFLAKRRMGVDIRDIYGRLLDGRGGETGVLRSGGGAAGRHLGGLGARSTKVVALFSGVVALDGAGRASIPVTMPDFNGRLRLMAIAFDAKATGSASTAMIVRDPVVAELALPRFLAPGDEAQATLSVDIPDKTTTGRLEVSLTTTGPVMLTEPLAFDIETSSNGRQRRGITLRAGEPGIAKLVLAVSGANGIDIKREWRLTIRPAEAHATLRKRRKLSPGGRLLVGEALLDGFYPTNATATISIDNGLGLDIGSVIGDLARYPYGCLEQTVSKNLPLVVFRDLAEQTGASPDKKKLDVGARVEGAIRRVLSMQRSDGAFGLWSFGSPPEFWLSAYAVDFLTRAREAGYTIDIFALRNALRWLNYSTQVPRDAPAWRWEAAAYAFYVLSSNGAANLGDLRYFADNNGARLTSPLAKAHLAAALARFGENARANTLATSAISNALAPRSPDTAATETYYRTYGSPLRDTAATLAMAVRAGLPHAATEPLIDRIADLWAQASYPSTQGRAWMLLAGEALLERKKEILIGVDGAERRIEGSFSTTADISRLRDGVELVNRGGEPMSYALTTSGYPSHSLSPDSAGYTVGRRFLSMTGDPVDLAKAKRGDLVVVVIDGELTSIAARNRRTMLVQLLPAGFEIETADFGGGVDVGGANNLGVLTPLIHRELRDDRYVAQLDISPRNRKFRVAFAMRAITPGRFVLPGVRVEDMYEPAVHARSEAGLTIVSPGDG